MKSTFKTVRHLGYQVNFEDGGWAIISYGIIDEMISEPYDVIYGWRIDEYHPVIHANGSAGHAHSTLDLYEHNGQERMGR